MYPLPLRSNNTFSTCLAPSTFAIPTVGFSIPSDFAVAIPYNVFLTIASTLLVAEVPVVVARSISRPLAGVITLPTVDTPIGKL